MIDNDIIKALECCKQNCLSKCLDCPAGKVYEFCSQKIINDALNLVKRQKEEIEKLQKRHRLNLLKQLDIAEKIKSEAIKDFAERLKERAVWDDKGDTKIVYEYDIDSLVNDGK